MSVETMTTGEVQVLLGFAHAASARKQLARWGIEPVGRTLAGEKTWPAAAVRAKAASRPGRGARTDLRRG